MKFSILHEYFTFNARLVRKWGTPPLSSLQSIPHNSHARVTRLTKLTRVPRAAHLVTQPVTLESSDREVAFVTLGRVAAKQRSGVSKLYLSQPSCARYTRFAWSLQAAKPRSGGAVVGQREMCFRADVFFGRS